MISHQQRLSCNGLIGGNFLKPSRHAWPLGLSRYKTPIKQISCSAAAEPAVSTQQEGPADENAEVSTQEAVQGAAPSAGTPQKKRRRRRRKSGKEAADQQGEKGAEPAENKSLQVTRPDLPKRTPAKQQQGRTVVERRWKRVVRPPRASAPVDVNWPQDVPVKARLESVVGIEMEFLVPGNAGGFLMGKRAQRMRAMGSQHGVGVQITRQTNKHLRSLRLYSHSPEGIVSYWNDLWSRAAAEKVELLDKTLDGSQYKLSMKIPGDVAGRLLGINGEQIQSITTSTECALRMTAASNAEALDSDFRLLQMAGTGPALLAAIKEVLRILWQKEKFRKVLSVPGYIQVPEAQVEAAAAIIPEVLLAHPGLKSISWVQPPKKVEPGQSGDRRLMVLGPPAQAAAAKQQIESQWGTVSWSRSEWPGLNLPPRQGTVVDDAAAETELPQGAQVAGVGESTPGVQDIQAEFGKIKESMQV